jgi:transcriptional regulator with XRE-family HTH domain
MAVKDNGQQTLVAKEVGRRIAQSRKELDGMTQRELGDLVSVTERSVAAWELGEVIPYRHMRRLEEVLQRPASWLLYGESATPPNLQQQLDDIFKQLSEIKTALKSK